MDNRGQGVLISCPFFSPNIGGVESHLDNLCDYLGAKGYHVYVVTYQPLTTNTRGLSAEKGENLKIWRINWPGFNLFHKLERCPLFEFLYITPMLFAATFIFLIFNRKKIDLIHAHGFNSALIGRLAKLFFKKRVVVSTHSVYGLRTKSFFSRVLKWALNGADAVLAVSRPSLEELARIGVTKDKLSLYTYWVDQNIFKPLGKQSSKEYLGWAGRFVVLFAGRFIAKKGIRELIEAAGLVKKEALFAFVGEGPLEREIETAAEKKPDIVLVGKVSNEKMALYYSAADVVCVPSLYDEAFGRVIAESLSCGVPVIASDKGGIPDVLDDHVGILIDPKPAGIAGAVDELNTDPARLKDMSGNCREFAIRRFSVKNAEVITSAYYDKEKVG